MGADGSVPGVVPITSVDDISTCLPEYSGVAHLSPTRTGVADDADPDWLNDDYAIDQAALIARILTDIDDCIIVSDSSKRGCEALSDINAEAFGGVVVGCFQSFEQVDGEMHVTVSNLHHLVVLYASALMLTQYEKELSHRVLASAEQRYIDSVNRKYSDQKRRFKRTLTHSHHNTSEFTISTDVVDMYSVHIDEVTPLVDC